MAEEKEVDWKKVFTAALMGDVADLFLDPIPVVGKVLGDVLDITYTLPQMRKELPEADKDVAYLATLAETIPFVELLPNWGVLAAGSYIRSQVLGKEGVSIPKELFGLPERGMGLKLGTARVGEERGRGKPRTEEERFSRHKTILEELGLPALEDFLPSMKKRK